MKKVFSEKGITARFILPLLLLLFSFVGCTRGADLSDTMYSVGNYAFFDSDAGNWHYATYIANLTGRLFYLLGGGRLIFVNLLCSLVPAGTALAVYYCFKDRVNPLLLFLSELAALGLCWSPSVILYQQESYLVLVAGSLLLYFGMSREKRKLLCAAGLVLGLGALVRISNLLYPVLILFVIYERQRKKQARELLKDIGICVAGYLGGLAAAFLLLLAGGGSGGLQSMAAWILGLFGGSSGGGGYTPQEMLLSILDNYAGNLRYFLGALAVAAAGSLLFFLLKEKLRTLAAVLTAGGIALLMVWYFRNGVFDLKYYNVGSIFRISVVVLLGLILLDLAVLADRRASEEEKALAFLALLVQLITPLGSNNHLYSCINNMYLLLPAALITGSGMLGRCKKERPWRFPLAALSSALLLLLLVQSVLFGLFFVFKEGNEGQKLAAVITEPAPLEGIRTTEGHAEALKGLSAALGKREGTLLTYGDIPGLHYALGLASAVSTSWPDLESYPRAQYESELAAVSGRGERPLVILSAQADALQGDEAGEKLSLLREFLYNGAYVKTYGNEEFAVYESVEE
ncbi:MAG: hypothetical protein K6E50_03535 [Lachnospiraceae bacterium]|nr:hypothetical protein [Lachnospiraceae bacterium]